VRVSRGFGISTRTWREHHRSFSCRRRIGSSTSASFGRGFDPGHPRSQGSFGLIGMRERTELLGGEFRLSSQPGVGTSVEIILS
jgi:hypothetical protein